MISLSEIGMVSLFSSNGINDHVAGKVRQFMHECKYFSLASDERTDVMDVSQLLILTRTIDSTFECTRSY